MKKYRLPLLLALPLVLSACGGGKGPGKSSTPSSSEEVIDGYVKKDVTAKMTSHFGESFGEELLEDTCLYNDYWFLEDGRNLSYPLALMSSMVAGVSSAYTEDRTGGRIAALLMDMGYNDIAKNAYFAEDITLKDSIGAIIGKKVLKDRNGEDYTLLALFPRNEGYGEEWAGNFNIGPDGIHEGFLQARDEMLRFLKSYIDMERISGNVKLWTAGYSRGAAAVNLLAGYLGENTSYFGENFHFAPENLYVYTIGTPATLPATGVLASDAYDVEGPREDGYSDTVVPAYNYQGSGEVNPKDEKFSYIHNFIAVGDYITKLPPKEWGFTRYGVDESVLYGDEDFRRELERYSPETAAKFEDKNYATEVPTRTFDLDSFSLVDGKGRQSADAMLDERFSALMGLAETRNGFIEKGYADILASALGIFGTEYGALVDAATEEPSDLIKIGVYALIDHLAKATDSTEAEALATVLETLLRKDEGEEPYTDQAFLSDLLDFLINDYQDEAAPMRFAVVATLIPAPYNKIYTGVLEYAKEHEMTPHNFDELVHLIASYVNDNKEDENVIATVEALAGLVPEQYASMVPSLLSGLTGKDYTDEQLYPDNPSKIKAVIFDVMDCCVNGSVVDETVYTPGQARYFVLGLAFIVIGMQSSMPLENLQNLVLNGAFDGEEVIVKDPAPLSVITEDILNFAMPVDEDEGGEKTRVPAGEAADREILSLLSKSRTERNAAYIDKLSEHPEKIREIAVAVLLNPGETFDLHQEIENAITFIETIQFVAPAHFQEMYVCYLKTKIS